MEKSRIVLHLAELSLVLSLACSSEPSKSKSPEAKPDAGGAFTVAGCKTDTCGTEATKCGWDKSASKYTTCLLDCELLGKAYAVCPEKVSALYSCAALGTKVDCTTGEGTGCDAEEQQASACVLSLDAGN